MSQNKATFFKLDYAIDEAGRSDPSLDLKLSHSLDFVLFSMGATTDTDVYKTNINNRVTIVFKSSNRKRLGQLFKLTSEHFDTSKLCISNVEVSTLTRMQFKNWLNQQRMDKKLVNDYASQQGYSSLTYDGDDIAVFSDKKNWYPWQSSMYNMIFEDDETLKKPDLRKIVILVDFLGCSGKTSFLKYLMCKSKLAHEIGRTTYGTTQQIRSQIVLQGVRSMYFIDLTRAKGRWDSNEDLLSVLEELKSGFVLSSMRGANNQMIFPPPHVFIFTNQLFEFELLSRDRWSVFEIVKNKLGKENALLKKQERKNKLKK